MQGRISQIVGNELNSANEQQGLGVAVLVLVLIISPVIIFLVRSATITIQVGGSIYLGAVVEAFFAAGLLLEPGPQGVRAEHGKAKGGQASLSGCFLFLTTFFLPSSLSTRHLAFLSLFNLFLLRCFHPLWPKHFSLRKQSLLRRMNQSRYKSFFPFIPKILLSHL